MKVTIDTKEDSHEEIKKIIRMLQNLVGGSQEIFTNEPQAAQESSPMANIFGETSNAAQESQAPQESQAEEAQAQETTTSTEDLFAELFSEEELKKMEAAPAKEEEKEEHAEEEELPKAKSKKYSIEFY